MIIEATLTSLTSSRHPPPISTKAFTCVNDQTPRPPKVHTKLNERWCTLWDRQQWNFEFNKIWDPMIVPKKSCLLWLILHKAI